MSFSTMAPIWSGSMDGAEGAHSAVSARSWDNQSPPFIHSIAALQWRNYRPRNARGPAGLGGSRLWCLFFSHSKSTKHDVTRCGFWDAKLL